MSEPKVALDGVGKMYKIFGSRTSNLLDVLGVPGPRRGRFREFWALRNVDLQLERGERLGIIGRNGAGKSTLLKLITRNVEPTEGDLRVNGVVQALLEVGGGLHPEFTGLENIRASLGLMGLGHSEVADAEREIGAFTELGRFLDQPFKTYSMGMQARLAFGIATTVQPDILIVDEVLGAGDAYFFTKSTDRMRQLIESGASVLLVSHALDQVVRFCDRAIWLDRGEIVMRGPSTEVVKAYERFTRELEDRRLQARNHKATLPQYDAFERESYTDQLVFEIDGTHPVDVAEVVLTRDGVREDAVRCGAPQDADSSQSASISADGSDWSEPRRDGELSYRASGANGGTGVGLFNLWFRYPTSTYTVAVTYRTDGNARLRLRTGDGYEWEAALPPADEWTVAQAEAQGQTAAPHQATARETGPSVSRWPGEGSILIDQVQLLDEEGHEQAVFTPGSTLTLVITARATQRLVAAPVQPAATFYRADGVLATNLTGPILTADVEDGAQVVSRLELPSLNLGDGRYVLSVALYKSLSHIDVSEAYDLLDRSFEFEVRGNTPFDNGVFSHPARWETETRGTAQDVARGAALS